MSSLFQPWVRFRQEDVGWAVAGMYTAAPEHSEQGALSVQAARMDSALPVPARQ